MNSFGSRSALRVGGKEYEIYRLKALDEKGISTRHLPYSLRILLENLLRTEDGRNVTESHGRSLLLLPCSAGPTGPAFDCEWGQRTSVPGTSDARRRTHRMRTARAPACHRAWASTVLRPGRLRAGRLVLIGLASGRRATSPSAVPSTDPCLARW